MICNKRAEKSGINSYLIWCLKSSHLRFIVMVLTTLLLLINCRFSPASSQIRLYLEGSTNPETTIPEYRNSNSESEVLDSDKKKDTDGKDLPTRFLWFIKGINESISIEFWGFISVLGNIFLGIFTVWLKLNTDRLKKRALDYVNDIEGFRKPIVVGANERINSIMVVGLGGSGKTSLIRALIGGTNSGIDPLVKTADFEIHSAEFSIPAKVPKQVCQLYISDYPGQAFLEELIRGFIKQQSKPFSEMRYGYVTSLVLVVDLFGPPNLPNEEVSKHKEINQDRIDENLDAWNESAISAVFGMLTRSLRYICLFINKVDLLEDNIGEEQITDKYKRLLEKLTLRISGVKMRVFIGSALDGRNVARLREDLILYSVPSEDYE